MGQALDGAPVEHFTNPKRLRSIVRPAAVMAFLLPPTAYIAQHAVGDPEASVVLKTVGREDALEAHVRLKGAIQQHLVAGATGC